MKPQRTRRKAKEDDKRTNSFVNRYYSRHFYHKSTHGPQITVPELKDKDFQDKISPSLSPERQLSSSSEEESFKDPSSFLSNNYCHTCGREGTLVICESCPKVFHLKCLGLTYEPRGDFQCQFCLGTSAHICIKCYKPVVSITQFQDQIPIEQRRLLQMIPVKCVLCLSQLHLECAGVSPQFILKGAFYHELPQSAVETMTKKIDEFQKLKATGQVEELLALRNEAVVNQEQHLVYLCRVCQESREIDQVFDCFHPDQIEEEDSEEYYSDCYFLVKFEGASMLNAIWVPYFTVEELGNRKLQGFLKRHREREPKEDFDDSYFNIERCHMIPERVLRKRNKGKYYLVKWKNLDYTKCTWEIADFFKDRKELVEDFLKLHEMEKLLKASISERIEIMRGRSGMIGEIGQYLEEAPKFLSSDLKLHPYQLEGVNWMISCWEKRTNIILADEMGLGKTIQTIVFLSYLINVQMVSRPFLICVPLSTIENWKREFEIWCPEARVQSYVHGKNSRQLVRDKEFFFKLRKDQKGPRIPKFNVLLTSYAEILSDFKHLAAITWKMFLIDEGQRLKSNESKLFKYAQMFKSEFKVLLSGTPLQNNMSELFNLMEFIDPKVFNPQFKEQLASEFEQFQISEQNKLIKRNKTKASEEENDYLEGDHQFEKEENFFCKLQELLKPYILRRFKRDVFKEFPKKKELIINVEMTKRQKDISRCILKRNFQELSELEKHKSSGKVSLKSANNIIMCLRQTANHPLLLGKLYSSTEFKNMHHDKEMEQQITNASDLVKDSGKMEYLDKMLAKLLERNHKILIFSQFKEMLNIIQDYLKFKEIPCLRLDGDTENVKRQRLIDQFNETGSIFNIFLLSTKAGGLGINLASADTIIIFDSDFNPHNDIQALNRAHRIGQKNNVMIYRFACKGSVEERILELAKHKLMLDTIVAHSQKAKVGQGSVVYKILRFGTKKLFGKTTEDQESSDYIVDDEEVVKLLDRENQFQEDQLQEPEENDGVRDYLSGFKVANIEKKSKTEDRINIEQLEREREKEGFMEPNDETESEDEELFQKMWEEEKGPEDQAMKEEVLPERRAKAVVNYQEHKEPNVRELRSGILKKSTPVPLKVVMNPQHNGTHSANSQDIEMKDVEKASEKKGPLPQKNTQVQPPSQPYSMAPACVQNHMSTIQNPYATKQMELICQKVAELIEQDEISICHDPNGNYSKFLLLQFTQKDANQLRLSESHQKLLETYSQEISEDFLLALEVNFHPMIGELDRYLFYWGLTQKNRADLIREIMKFGFFFVQEEYIAKKGKDLDVLHRYSNSLFTVSPELFKDYFFKVTDFLKVILKRPPLLDEPQFLFGGFSGKDVACSLHKIEMIKKKLEKIFFEVNDLETLFETIWLFEQAFYGFREYEDISEDALWILLGEGQAFSQINDALRKGEMKFEGLKELRKSLLQRPHWEKPPLTVLFCYLRKTGKINEQSLGKQGRMKTAVARQLIVEQLRLYEENLE